jgi:Zn-dependent peptidase ImmA (M78 family)
VEDIIERHLGLALGFEDLEERLGMRDVLGATYVRSRRIVINERLLEERHEGRLVFTLAHEVGHWDLHRAYADEAARRNPTAETIVCRSGRAKEPIEWQADYFAACLVMPEPDVLQAFAMAYGTDMLVLQNERRTIGRPGPGCIEPCAENWPFLAAMVCEIGGFTNVSKQAMAIRLQDLGLLVNASGAPLGWAKPEG